MNSAAPMRECRGYRSATYDQGPHSLPDDAAHFYSHKKQCKACYLAYAADWRATRQTKPARSKRAATGSTTTRREVVIDGVESLRRLLARARYPSIIAAVAGHAIFLPPATVKQSGGCALFPTIRDYADRGKRSQLPNGRPVLLDDNGSPTDAFLWSAGLANGRDVQYNHVWTVSKDPDAYTALWNICATPAFLAKTTDGSNHPEVQAALRYHAYQLYGHVPAGYAAPHEPEGYSSLKWAPFAPAVSDLEAELRRRLASNRKSRTAIACREIGWLFSKWRPDSTI